MIGWVKIVSETSEELLIAYSFEGDKNCDGLLRYDKKQAEFQIEREPQNMSWMKPLLICPLRFRIEQGMEPDKMYMIMTG